MEYFDYDSCRGTCPPIDVSHHIFEKNAEMCCQTVYFSKSKVFRDKDDMKTLKGSLLLKSAYDSQVMRKGMMLIDFQTIFSTNFLANSNTCKFCTSHYQPEIKIFNSY